jgi:2-polyprenyl-6-hydroxyphenyl methylase/3-demethylubiquinone-9 3-methyltransferase
VLDSDFLTGLGGFDVVYAWGVLHHTGDMRLAMDNAAGRVAPGGLLFVALYNDQGRMSQIWSAVKRAYVSGPHALRGVLLVLCGAVLWAPAFARGLRRGRPLEEWRTYESTRGMSKKHDLVDWVGGYPFEVATPAEVFDFYNERSFQLQAMVTRPGLGCNEFVLRRDPSPQEPA